MSASAPERAPAFSDEAASERVLAELDMLGSGALFARCDLDGCEMCSPRSWREGSPSYTGWFKYLSLCVLA